MRQCLRTFGVGLVALGVLAATPASHAEEHEFAGFPTFSFVPPEPDDMGSNPAAHRAWDLYRFLAARQIAADQMSPAGLINVDAVIVIETEESMLVKLAGTEQGEAVSYFSVSIPRDESSEAVVTAIEPAAPLTGEELAQYAAQTYWLDVEQDLDTCDVYYSHIAVPVDQGGWMTYLLPVSQPGGALQIGGTFRKQFPGSEETASAPARLTHGCSAWDFPSGAVAYVVSTPVKRPPNEMDILMSIYLDIPLFLGNAEDGTVWAVEESGFWDVTEMLQ